MSIEALEYIALDTGMSPETCLVMILDGANRSRCTADELSEAWWWAIKKYTSPEEALKTCESLFNAGYDLPMMIVTDFDGGRTSTTR